jgi:DNA polymerase III delta prime subunit
MTKNQLYTMIINSALLLPLHSLSQLKADPQQDSQIIKVLVIGQPESELSKAFADILKFAKDGIRSQWMRYTDIQYEEKRLSQGSKIDKAHAVLSAAFRGVLLVTPPLVGLLVLEGTKIGLEVIKRDILTPKPAILIKKQKPLYGRMDRLRRWWSGAKTQKMIFNQETRDRLIEIEKKTSSLHNLIKTGKDRTYANLLLHGEPGTGKTLFACMLAEKTNMDFLPVTAASLLQAGVAGIKYFDELISMANNSTYGTIIFIDEADALFTNRNAINPDSEHYKVLSHILSIIDGRSDKFMIIAATNHAYLLDSAMERRFQDRVLMPLPDAATRTELITLYSSQILFNEKQTNAQFIVAAKALFTSQLIAEIATKTVGFSHAEIADMIGAMRDKAELNNRSLLIQDIQSATDEAIEKKQVFKADKRNT